MLAKLFLRPITIAAFITLVCILTGLFFVLKPGFSNNTTPVAAIASVATATATSPAPLPDSSKQAEAIPTQIESDANKVSQPVATHPAKVKDPVTPPAFTNQPTALPQGLNYLTLANVPSTVFIPASLTPGSPSQLLLAFHGMGGNGQDMCDKMLAFAEQNKVVVIAPTFSYNPDYTNIEVVRTEDIQITATINEMVTAFEAVSQIQLKDHYLLYGFSRGAQIAHRFATLYPQHVLGVAVLAAGTYTLPFAINQATNLALPWPYGIADLQSYTGKQFDEADFLKVHFWLEVGDQDNDSKGISRAWDKLLGTTRLERSKNYYQALKQAGVDVHWSLISNTGHSENGAMRGPVLNYFARLLNRTEPVPSSSLRVSGTFYPSK